MVREDLLDRSHWRSHLVAKPLAGGEATCFAWFAIAIAIAIDLRFDERVVVRFAIAIAIEIGRASCRERVLRLV
jgi:hypothetical protein